MNQQAMVDRIMVPIDGVIRGTVREHIRRLEAMCESPIEVMLGAAMLILDQSSPWGHDRLMISTKDCLSPTDRFLVPQYQVGAYRTDFAYILDEVVTLIECDGHDFHERTKEQAQRDKRRDREIIALGYPILHFTGSEIYADPVLCASQVFEFVWSADRRGNEKSA